MAATAGYRGFVLGPTGNPVAFTNSPMSDTGTTRITYRINDTTLRYWDRNAPVTVQTSPDGVTWTTVTDYTVQHPGGIVVFNTARAAGTQVRVSASAYPMAEIAGCTGWSADFEVDSADNTQLNTPNGAKTSQPTLISGNGTLDGFWIDAYFFSKLQGRGIVALGLVDGTGGTYAVYTFLSKLGIGDTVDELITESRDFTIDGRWFYN